MKNNFIKEFAVTLPRALCLLCALPSVAATAVSSGTLRGQVLDAQGRPIGGAVITLSQRISGYKQVVRGDAQGRYTVHNIPFNDYHLEVQAAGYRDLHQEVELRSALPIDLTVRLQEASTEVVVEERLEMVEDHPSVHLDIDKSAIQISPAPVRSRAMESILIATPGVIQDENGRFHFKGSHGQVMYVVDGIPVTDQMQLTFSNSLDPSQVESMEVITGGISAEHGGKPAAVVAVTSKSGLGTPDGFEGEVNLGVARYATAEAGLSVRGGNDHFGWFVTGAASRSDRFADPVNFENLHNAGQTGRLFSRFDWVLGDSDTIRLSVGGGSTTREVPNLLSQSLRGQDQRSQGTDTNVSLAWTHLFTSSRSLDVSAYVRHSRARLDPSDQIAGVGSRDLPLWATQDRSLGNRGIQATYSERFGAEDSVKAGLQYVAFPIHEAFRFTITDPGDADLNSPLSPFYPYSPAGGGAIFTYEESIQSALASAFVQYDLHRGPLFLGLGVRADRYTVRSFTQTQVQPRLGLSYRTALGPVLRASYDRLMITPENENLALSTSQQAWNLGPNPGTPVPPLRPELQNSFSYGVEQALGKAGRISVEYWEKQSHNAADNEQFLNSGVLFPVAAARGLFRGVNVRLDAAFSKTLSTYVSFGKTRALFEAPVVGGLQLETPDAAPGERFLVDHDQKVSAQWGIRHEADGFYSQLVGRYDSGLVSGDPANAAGNPDLAFGIRYVRKDGEGTWRIRPRTIWNLSLGQRWKLSGRRSVEGGLDLLNLTDEQGLYNFMSVFGGTHVIPPRTVAARIKFGF